MLPINVICDFIVCLSIISTLIKAYKSSICLRSHTFLHNIIVHYLISKHNTYLTNNNYFNDNNIILLLISVCEPRYYRRIVIMLITFIAVTRLDY